MKIGYEAQRLFRNKKHGIEIVSLEILRALQMIDQDNKYEVFAKTDSDHSCLLPSVSLKIHRTPAFPYPIWEQLFLPLFSRKCKVEILHCTANTAPLFYAAPLVVTIHDLIYLDKIEMKGSSYQNFGNLYRRWIVPIIAKKAAAIITVSSYAKNEIVKKLHIPEHKIFVIHNGVHEKFRVIAASQIINAFKKKYQLPLNFFLHFANEAPRKNTLGTLRAFVYYCKNNPTPLHLVLTNTNVEKIIKMLNSIQASEVSKFIVCLPYLPAADLPLLYNAAELFLYPSYNEGFGLPIIEAMACGTPVITANNSSLPEVAGDAAFLVDADNHQQLANAMASIASDENRKNKMIEKGLKQAAKFNWHHAANKTKEVYQMIQQQLEK
jgi:glycosyltransferase involved in cell wall biosynthesis